LVGAIPLSDHLLMRGLGALLRADICKRHREIGETSVIELYIALEASFQLVVRKLREQGLSNPSAADAGALIDETFNAGVDSGNYFEHYYDSRIKTMHPPNRFGVFPVAPLIVDDYYLLRHGIVEVYHWLITNRRLEPSIRVSS